MTDAGSEVRSFVASDGYPLHVRIWPAVGRPRGQVVVLHGVQSHGGWYHRLGSSLAARGILRLVSRSPRLGGELARSGPRPIGAAAQSGPGRVAARSAPGAPSAADRPGRNQLGRKTRRDRRGPAPRAGRCLGADLPRASPPRRRLPRRERLEIAWAFFTNRRKTFADPAFGPRALHGQPGRPVVHRRRPLQSTTRDGRLAGRQLHHRPSGRARTRSHPPAGPADAGGPGSDCG